LNIISIFSKKHIINTRLCSDAVFYLALRDLYVGNFVFILEYFFRERSRAFGGAVTKLDKLCPNIVRKRSRGDGSSNERVLSSGGAIPKNVPQSHLNADDMEVGLQRGEERTKNAGQNRRIRTSIVEVVPCI